jgi:methanogenic corrinoid protein MtbC1
MAASARAPRKGKLVLLASVPGNLHDLGARMVSDQLDLDGFQVAFLGANTPARDLALAARDLHPDLIALSVQLGSQLRGAAALVALLRRS